MRLEDPLRGGVDKGQVELRPPRGLGGRAHSDRRGLGAGRTGEELRVLLRAVSRQRVLRPCRGGTWPAARERR